MKIRHPLYRFQRTDQALGTPADLVSRRHGSELVSGRLQIYVPDPFNLCSDSPHVVWYSTRRGHVVTCLSSLTGWNP